MMRGIALSRLWINKRFIEPGEEFEYEGELPKSLVKPLTPEQPEEKEEKKEEPKVETKTEYRINEFIPYHLKTNAELLEMISDRKLKYPERRNKDSLVAVLEAADREMKDNDES